MVGTHALIQQTVAFGRLGVAVVDEQHRFGVLQREALARKGYDADVLVMACSVAAGAGALAVSEADWEIAKVKAGAAFGGAAEWEGWVGTALYDEANPRYVTWREAYTSRFGPAPTGSLLDKRRLNS